ncbi:sulfite exporter TauE/SafE family protein [Nocardioides terrisoli]|uniref:sulfite exporter TauE/SafE family protein n=1 Tax=Nocardioides terrisoli TaxID=3388267 RepID=UPI00287BB1CE|nr:sulfite exporter TauE/SafE family protein [Nocardioides marmorisolisilvae]
MTPDLLPLLATGLVAFGLAAVAQAVTGFGSALVSVPLLTLVVHPAEAVVAATLLGLVLAGWGASRERAHADRPRAGRLVLTGALGIPIGLALLLVLDERVLQLVIGSTVLVLVALLAAGLRIRSTSTTLTVAGLTSGALLTSTGMNGPPLVMVLRGLSPRTSRATLQVVFCVQDAVAVVGFGVVGRLTAPTLALAAAGALAVPVGWRIGDGLFHRLPARALHWLVLGGLAASGCAAVLAAR